MLEELLKDFSIHHHEQLYEKETTQGVIAVLKTDKLGKVLTIDKQIYLSEQDGFFFYEMMSHPALFTHPLPKKVAIIGPIFGILKEVLKHEKIQKIDLIDNQSHLTEAISHFFSPEQPEKDSRISFYPENEETWVSQCDENRYDVIIHTQPSERLFPLISRLLTNDGILVQPHNISLLQPNILTGLQNKFQHNGFSSWQILNFAQPSHPGGWRILSMATKYAVFRRVREIEVFNRSFTTRYYNYDVHKAALTLPEFANYLFSSDTL